MYDYLASLGRKCSQGFHLQKLLDKLSKSGELVFGHRVTKYSFPAVKGESRMCEASFLDEYYGGRYILRLAGHFAAVVNGTVRDTFWSGDSCVYTAFKFDKEITHVKS